MFSGHKTRKRENAGVSEGQKRENAKVWLGVLGAQKRENAGVCRPCRASRPTTQKWLTVHLKRTNTQGYLAEPAATDGWTDRPTHGRRQTDGDGRTSTGPTDGEGSNKQSLTIDDFHVVNTIQKWYRWARYTTSVWCSQHEIESVSDCLLLLSPSVGPVDVRPSPSERPSVGPSVGPSVRPSIRPSSIRCANPCSVHECLTLVFEVTFKLFSCECHTKVVHLGHLCNFCMAFTA